MKPVIIQKNSPNYRQDNWAVMIPKLLLSSHPKICDIPRANMQKEIIAYTKNQIGISQPLLS